MVNNETVVVRPGKDLDVPFIFATWLKGLRYGNELFELIDATVYFEVYHQVIQKILTAPGTQVSVACLSSDPDTIVGYAVSNGATLHWVHVKSAWRNIGVAKQLVAPTTTTVTHVTKVGIGILKNHPKLSFNPFL